MIAIVVDHKLQCIARQIQVVSNVVNRN